MEYVDNYTLLYLPASDAVPSEICITKDTELADNDTIKKAAAIPLEPSGRSLRRKEKQKEKQSEATTYALLNISLAPLLPFDTPSPF